MQFCTIYPTEGSRGRKTKGTDECVIREMNSKKNDGGDDMAVGMAVGGATGSHARSKSCLLLEFHNV